MLLTCFCLFKSGWWVVCLWGLRPGSKLWKHLHAAPFFFHPKVMHYILKVFSRPHFTNTRFVPCKKSLDMKYICLAFLPRWWNTGICILIRSSQQNLYVEPTDWGYKDHLQSPADSLKMYFYFNKEKKYIFRCLDFSGLSHKFQLDWKN